MSERVSDFALIVGHVWRCTSCRDALLENPTLMAVGYKLSDPQRDCIANLDEEDFGTVMRLAEVTGLTTTRARRRDRSSACPPAPPGQHQGRRAARGHVVTP